GGAFSLGTTISQIGYTYQWDGPNGFQSQSQYPSLVTDVVLADSGVYTLVISNNGCTSDPASTVVRVRPRPDQPVLFSDGVVCNGDSLRFSSNIMGGDLYTWTAPNGTNLSTTDPSLLILNANASHSGNWVVTVLGEGCSSTASDSVNVFVEQPPVLIATNNGPICAGDSVRLVANDIPGASYLWSGPGSFSTIGRRVDAPGIQGNYTVRVSSSLGCVSAVSTNVQTYAATQITAISTDGTDCFFRGDSIRLIPTIFPADDGSYTYNWSGSNGFMSSDAIPIILLDSSTSNHTYSLQVMDGNGCDSEVSTVSLNLQQAPPRPPIDGPSLICSGDALTLTSRPYAGLDVLYLWQTPLGIDTTLIPSLTISPVQPINSGDYSLRVYVDGCSSRSSIFIPVEVSAVLPSPIVIASSPVCAGDTIRLSTNVVAGATYQWTGPDNFQFDGPETFIANVGSANAGNYAVRIDVNGCTSPFSIPVNVEVRPIPDVPILEAVDPICIDAPNSGVRLQFVDGTAVQGASYTWFEAENAAQIGGPTFSTSYLLNDFEDYGEGTFDFFVVADVGGCSSLPSIPLSIEMHTFVADVAMAGTDQSLCDVNSITLNAEVPDLATGQWRQTSGPLANILQVDQATTQVDDLIPNTNYTFEWVLSNGVCRDYDSDEVQIFIGQNNAIAFAGDDFVDCGSGSVLLMADQPMAGSGMWTSPDPNVSFSDAQAPETQAEGLEDGAYLFVWTVENGICGMTADTVFVEYELAPLAEDDFFESDYAAEVFIEVLENDRVPLDFQITLMAGPTNGSVENLEDGMFRYKAGETFTDMDEFRYRLCSESCPDVCAEAVVQVRLIRNLACEAPTIFTPNDDGINDTFEIPCFDSGQYPNNKVSVFNQWGDEIFSATPYRNDWAGTYDGEPLPIGTYFYLVELGNGQEPISGFLVLER
ncbi:MAG: gliding motility-associated C-terminal domain-containing protein, partial [Bacteroidota bacterium]